MCMTGYGCLCLSMLVYKRLLWHFFLSIYVYGGICLSRPFYVCLGLYWVPMSVYACLCLSMPVLGAYVCLWVCIYVYACLCLPMSVYAFLWISLSMPVYVGRGYSLSSVHVCLCVLLPLPVFGLYISVYGDLCLLIGICLFCLSCLSMPVYGWL